MKAKMTLGAWFKKKFEEIEKKLNRFVDGDYVNKSINDNIFDHITIKDEITSNKYFLKISNGVLVTEVFPINFYIDMENTKTNFTDGEYIKFEDLDISLVYPSGNKEKVTDWTNIQFSKDIKTPLNKEYDKDLTLSYVYDGELLFTTTLELTIGDFDPAVTLVDFEYTDNNNGTYTIGGWKGTLNGQPSTEIVIPNNSKIILQTIM